MDNKTKKVKELTKKEADGRLRLLVKEWSSNSDMKLRLKSFVYLMRFVKKNPNCKEKAFKLVYLTFVKYSRQYNSHIHDSFIFMRNSVAEFFSTDPSCAYQHAFVYIRQLAIHVRNCMLNMNQQNINTVYSWQFINCLRVWAYIITRPSLASSLSPLVYPLTQVIDATVHLINSPRYYPLRLTCVQMLIDIIKGTNSFIPVAPLLLTIIETERFHRKPQALKGKMPDIEYTLRVSDDYLKYRPVQDLLVNKSITLLTEYVNEYHQHITYPELCYPIIHRLRRCMKECRVSTWNASMKSLIQRMEKQMNVIMRERESISGAPKDIKEPIVGKK